MHTKNPLPVQDVLQRVFKYDLQEGILRWKMRRDSLGIRAGDAVKIHEHQDGYMEVRVFDRHVKVHLLIYKLHYGDEPEQVDHIDQDKKNNRLENLRAATQAQNQANRTGWSDGYKGVYKNHKGRFRSIITIKSKQKSLGTFDTQEEAAKAYNDAASKAWGEFAHLNEIPQ
jgi:hypothetical protein